MYKSRASECGDAGTEKKFESRREQVVYPIEENARILKNNENGLSQWRWRKRPDKAARQKNAGTATAAKCVFHGHDGW